MSRTPEPPAGLPRLLHSIPTHGAMSFAEHLATHGEAPQARRRADAASLIDRLERAGLRGRGGGAFPTAIKLRAAAKGRRRPVVVANALEGEPTSLKDRTLIEALPHLVLDGAVLAAQAIGAEEAILCVPDTIDSEPPKRAIAERARIDGELKIHLAVLPRRYITGQESALVNRLNGGPALPTFTPPLPFERGVGRRPTSVNNAETLAHVALIARHGSRWFRELGSAAEPGSMLLTLTGAVAQPGVYEVELGTPLVSLLEAAAGTPAPPRAALLGGYAGAWVSAEALHELALSDEHLARHGARLGAGVVVLLSKDACGVAETAKVLRWMAQQSARQCGPCRNGLDAIATSVEALAAGSARSQARQHIARLASLTHGRGACSHPDGTVRFLRSALEVFAEELAEHAKHGACEACRQPGELPLPDATRPPPAAREMPAAMALSR